MHEKDLMKEVPPCQGKVSTPVIATHTVCQTSKFDPGKWRGIKPMLPARQMTQEEEQKAIIFYLSHGKRQVVGLTLNQENRTG